MTGAQASSPPSALIAVGSGGVGKTSVAASLALASALAGRSSLVLTIDPARRLADALGIGALAQSEVRIPDEAFTAAGLTPRAPMSAMMLDVRGTWDELVRRVVPPAVRERIFNSRFYLSLSTALAGSQEYIAMEKLGELMAARPGTLMVLDTPPSMHAVDFLEAPQRILDFFDHDAARALFAPARLAGRFGQKVVELGSAVAGKALSRLAGAEVIRELMDFIATMSSLGAAFSVRARATHAMFADPNTKFVVVAGTDEDRCDEALGMVSYLRDHHMHLAGLVVNGVQAAVPALAVECAASLRGEIGDQVRATIREVQTQAAIDAHLVARFAENALGVRVVTVPRLDTDIHDLGTLYQLARHLGPAFGVG